MVIVGGGMAGARACINLRANNYEGPITLISEEALLPYDRPPLSKASITEVAAPQPVWLLDDSIVASLKVTPILGSAVASIDRAAKTVLLGNGRALPYQKLLLATGAKPRRLTCPGGELALTLRDFKDAEHLRATFQPGRRIAIIGGGFIGLELASSAAKRGCSVSLIEAQPRILMRGVPQAIAQIVHDRHVAAGVDMIIGTGLKHLSSDGVHLSDGRLIAADTIVAGIGAAPEIKLAEAAGLAIENGIACSAELQSSDPDIYAAGDCCSFIHQGFGNRRIRLEAWRSAQEQAATAAENMLGGAKAHGNIPWFWSDQYDLSLQVAGMPDMGPESVSRHGADGALVMFHLTEAGRLIGASGIGVGNAFARDVKLAEMMIARGISPAAAQLADSTVQLKALLKG
jgi:3-phenylpropionate/trans-cinnamate dioxygenase ferredoxin reductase component